MNLKSFKQQHTEDYSEKLYTRSFSGRMTKARYKRLHRFCRMNTSSDYGYCGHDWDCCGCVCGTEMKLSYSRNLVTITYTIDLNY